MISIPYSYYKEFGEIKKPPLILFYGGLPMDFIGAEQFGPF